MYNHQLDTFLKAAELHSFSKAAQVLYITPSAVMQQISSLEENLDVKLFDRTNHGVELTEAGKILQQDARILISFCNDSRRRLKNSSVSESIRIGTSMHFKPRFLSRILDEYLMLHPETQINITAITDTPTKESPFPAVGSTYDIREGIRFRTSRDDSQSLKLFDSPVVLAVPAKHALYNKKSIRFRDLSGQKILMLEKGHLSEMDALRNEIQKQSTAEIISSPFYGMDTYSYSQLYSIPFIIEPVYKDILDARFHLIPVETGITVPYELTYSSAPSKAVFDLISWIEIQLKSSDFRKRIIG